MARVIEEGRLRRELDQPPEVHDRHALAHVAHDGQVVRDEQEREAELTLEVGEEVQDLRLDRDVEGGHGLVAHEQTRAEGEGPGDPDPLALAAAEGVGVARHVVGGSPTVSSSSPTRAAAARRVAPKFRSGSPTMSRTVRRGFSDEYGSWNTTCTARRKSRSRRSGTCCDVAPVEDDASGCHRQETEDQPPDRRLAAAALAHESERLAGST